MKFEIEIDIEALIKEAIKEYVKENMIIHNKPGAKAHVHIEDTVNEVVKEESTPIEGPPISEKKGSTRPVTRPAPEGIEWEYAPKAGRRRSPEEIKLHMKELELNRNLTPQEKGEVKGHAQLESDAEEKAKQDTIEQAKLKEEADKMEAEAKKELEEEGVIPSSDDLFSEEDKVSMETNEAIKTEQETATEEEQKAIPETSNLEGLNSLFHD